MRLFAKGIRTTVIGFVLTSLVVLGGMTWATLANFEIARTQKKDEIANKRRVALWRMDAYMMWALGAQQAIPPSYYLSIFTPEPDSIWTLSGIPVDRERFRQRSPLFGTKLAHDWIDLYFQVDSEGHWSSPQIPDEDQRTIAQHIMRDPTLPSILSLRFSLSQLRDSITFEELQRRVDQSGAQTDPFIGPKPEFAPVQAQLAADSRRGRTREFQVRQKSVNWAQSVLTPAPQCWPVPVNEWKVDDENRVEFASPEERFDDVSVAISEAPIRALWLDTPEDRPKKLMFVRTGTADGQRFYQGFVADWQKLKHDIIEKMSIHDIFQDSDLVPVQEVADDPELRETVMVTIPARLTASELNANISAWSAWSSLRNDDEWKTLNAWMFGGWGFALTVLGLAGWGFANLIRVSARRMEFAYAVTHELRTPLTTFRLYTDMLSAGLVPEEKQQEYFETLNREAGRLSGLVEDVLEYARLENHKARLNPVATNGESLLKCIAQDLETRCRQAGIEPKTKNDIPDGEQLKTDIDLVQQITNVLVNNACRHAGRTASGPHGNGRQTPVVLVHLSADNGHVHVNVIDSGPGIDRLDAHDIFKPFRRGRNADATAQGGIGLGLALARSWASLLHGRLDLAARHHPTYGGAHFRLTIPTRLQA